MIESIFQLSVNSLEHQKRFLEMVLVSIEKQETADVEAFEAEISELKNLIDYMKKNKHRTLVAEVLAFM